MHPIDMFRNTRPTHSEVSTRTHSEVVQPRATRRRLIDAPPRSSHHQPSACFGAEAGAAQPTLKYRHRLKMCCVHARGLEPRKTAWKAVVIPFHHTCSTRGSAANAHPEEASSKRMCRLVSPDMPRGGIEPSTSGLLMRPLSTPARERR